MYIHIIIQELVALNSRGQIYSEMVRDVGMQMGETRNAVSLNVKECLILLSSR